MTAIASTYVPELGFAVGADSLRRDAKTGGVITDNARKIFSIEHDGVRLAYAWAGATSLFYGDGQEFSFLDETEHIGNTLAEKRPESIEEYTRQFAVKMHERLRSVRLPDGRLSNNPNVFPREEIAHVLIVGYYDGKPYRTGILFSQKDLRLQSPYRDDIFESPEDFHAFSGSAVVLKQFEPIMAPETLEEAAELIRQYIQACIDNRNNYADCAAFGGRVQVATITADEFKWIVPPVAL
jgi:hypothetical protein